MRSQLLLCELRNKFLNIVGMYVMFRWGPVTVFFLRIYTPLISPFGPDTEALNVRASGIYSVCFACNY